MKKKNLKIWVILLVLPIPLLLFVALLSGVARAIFGSANGGGVVLIMINIISLIIGMAAVLMLIGLPVWIIMLVVAYEHNHQLSSPPVQPTVETPAVGEQPTATPPTAPPTQPGA